LFLFLFSFIEKTKYKRYFSVESHKFYFYFFYFFEFKNDLYEKKTTRIRNKITTFRKDQSKTQNIRRVKKKLQNKKSTKLIDTIANFLYLLSNILIILSE